MSDLEQMLRRAQDRLTPEQQQQEERGRRMDRAGGALVGAFFAVLIGQIFYWLFIGWPYYSVWSNEMSGRAEMARAEQNRQIRVREAQAQWDAAKLLAQAEVERSRGVAESNNIIANGLGGAEGYLRYLYIQQLGNADKNERTVIYVPTEGLLPITEAGRSLKK